MVIAIFFLAQRKPGVSRYILLVLMLNMVIYVATYILHKLYYRFRTHDWRLGESFRRTTMLYGAASLLLMAGAGFFFIKELKSASKSAAGSRNLNKGCAISIFDNHDLWHFLSAGGLFYGFMFILTIEDHNMSVSRNNIPVF